MTSLLARWLADNRATLLSRWNALLREVPHHANGNSVVVHPDEQRILLASMFEGLISAADGDPRPLDDCLRLLRAFRTSPGEDELPERLALTFHLRRAAWDVLFDSALERRQTRMLAEQLEDLIEHTAITLANHWTASASIVSEQLLQTEQLLATLNDANDQADRLVLQISNLNEIARILSSSLDRQHLITSVGDKLAEVLGVAHLAIWLTDGEGRLCLIQGWGTPQLPDGLQLGDDHSTDIVLRAFQTGQELLDLNPAALEQGAWYQQGCAVLAVPLRAHDRADGVIVLQDPDWEGRLGRAQQSFVRSAASQSAIALQNARLYAEVRGFNTILEQRINERTRELQTERDMLETLRQIALEVSSTLDLDVLLQNCLNLLASIIGVEHGSIMLIDIETDHLVNRAVLGRSDVRGYTRFPIGFGVAGWVAQHRKPALVSDVSQDPRWVVLPEHEHDRKLIGSMITVPLIVQHDAMGVMQLSHDEIGFFNEDHLRLLNASAGEIALGIHNALLYEQIQNQLIKQGEMLRNERRATTQSTAILQSLSDGVLVCDTEGVVITVNPAVERILDRPIEELVILNVTELFRQFLGQQGKQIPIEDLLVHPLDNRGLPRSYSAKLQIGTRVVRLTLDPVLVSRNDVMGAVAVLRDITREVESERLKDEFIGTVSHELRTPMTSIKGYTQLLAMGSLGPINDSQREFLKTINTNAERMISIINDLLDITKIETGSVELDPRPLHLAEALGNVVMDVQTSLQARQHELVINIPPGLPLIRADARRFDQILSNLLSNAIKYTPQSGKITIEAREISEVEVPESQREGLRPGRYVQINVSDNGVGIALEDQSLVFERFYRTENPLKVEAGGTGLGLSLVRPLVRLFGGRIWLHSVVDEGSIFSIIVPIA